MGRKVVCRHHCGSGLGCASDGPCGHYSGEIAVAAFDTEAIPSNVALPGDTDPTLVPNIQRRLAQLSLYLAAVDDRVTRDTTAAIRDYQ